MADQTDLALPRGQAMTFIFSRSVGTQNISGWTLAFTVKQHYGDALALLSKSTASGITITDSVNGVFQITVTAVDMLSLPLPVGTFYYDVWRTDPGSEDRLAYGRFVVQRAVRVN